MFGIHHALLAAPPMTAPYILPQKTPSALVNSLPPRKNPTIPTKTCFQYRLLSLSTPCLPPAPRSMRKGRTTPNTICFQSNDTNSAPQNTHWFLPSTCPRRTWRQSGASRRGAWTTSPCRRNGRAVLSRGGGRKVWRTLPLRGPTSRLGCWSTGAKTLRAGKTVRNRGQCNCDIETRIETKGWEEC